MTIRVIPTRLLFFADGFCLAPGLIFIRPERIKDHALIEHEKVHAAQQAKLGVLRFWVGYLFNRSFRQRMEVEAYRVQLALSPRSLEAFARGLSTRYFLDLTHAQARELLIAST